jgi:uncharacterized 2Fe-2S/4Fe-4S cluster protein (DUF4445 family)
MKITIQANETIELQIPQGARLLDYIRDNDIYINAACGGKGSCQKCRIQLKTGFLPISNVDKRAFTAKELEAGWRLSCQSFPRVSCEVILPQTENLKTKARLVVLNEIEPKNVLWVCDLGSTGVVVQALNATGEPLVEAHSLNRQVRYGADVMTRLQFGQEGKSKELQQEIFKTIEYCISAITNYSPKILQETKKNILYCSGNSAMVSFLHGWDISSLAVSPFQPIKTDSDSTLANSFELKSLPLLGGFVGADTVAGLCYLEKEINNSDSWMLVDIGTNTEIVLKDENQQYWYGSAPAGPAFEGGNILKGMRAEPGAIAYAYYSDKKWDFETIGKDKPRGICGSGLMDILSESIKHDLIQKDGFIEGGSLPLYDSIFLTADDIREFQLAKSATRSACEILMDRAKTRPKTIYLAGTFAKNLRLESLQAIGLLPEVENLLQIGNSSLNGTRRFALLDEASQAKFIEKLRKDSHQIELALQEDFQEIFVKNLNF